MSEYDPTGPGHDGDHGEDGTPPGFDTIHVEDPTHAPLAWLTGGARPYATS